MYVEQLAPSIGRTSGTLWGHNISSLMPQMFKVASLPLQAENSFPQISYL